MPHVTLAGDRTGEYLIAEEHEDGTLVLAPAASQPADGLLGRDEAIAWVDAHAHLMLPPDDEG